MRICIVRTYGQQYGKGQGLQQLSEGGGREEEKMGTVVMSKIKKKEYYK